MTSVVAAAAATRSRQAPAGHIAAVTELGIGASVTNSIEHIWSALVAEYGHPLVLLEHYLAEDTLDQDGEHIDQVKVHDGQPQWRRIWPTPPSNPHHHEFEHWIHPLRELSTPPTLLGSTEP